MGDVSVTAQRGRSAGAGSRRPRLRAVAGLLFALTVACAFVAVVAPAGALAVDRTTTQASTTPTTTSPTTTTPGSVGCGHLSNCSSPTGTSTTPTSTSPTAGGPPVGSVACGHLGDCPSNLNTGTQSSSGSGQGSTGCGSGPGLIGSLIDFVTGNTQQIAQAVTCGVVSTLFPTTSHGPGTWLIADLVQTPNYTQDGTNLAQVGKNTVAIGIGIDSATITFAVVWFWLMGLVSMGGGMSGAEGIARGLGALFLIVLWHWGSGQMIAAANSLASSTISAGVQSRLGTAVLPYLVIGAPFIAASGTFGLILGIILALLGLILFIGLMLMKMAIGAALAVGYVAMPILIALGVLPPLAWLPKVAIKGFITILLIPFIWAVIFAVFTAFAADTLTFGNFTLAGAGVWGTLLRPLISLMLLLMLIWLPVKLARMATFSAVLPGSGKGVGTGGMLASRLGASAVQAHMPESLGGKRRAGEELPKERMSYWRDDEGQPHSRTTRTIDPNSDEAASVRAEEAVNKAKKAAEKAAGGTDDDSGGKGGKGQQNGHQKRKQGHQGGGQHKGKGSGKGHANGNGGGQAGAADVFGDDFSFGAGQFGGNGSKANGNGSTANGQQAAAAAAAGAATGGTSTVAGAAAGGAGGAGTVGGAAGAGAAGAGGAGEFNVVSAEVVGVEPSAPSATDPSAGSSPGGSAEEVFVMSGNVDEDGAYEVVPASEVASAPPIGGDSD
jgi:hypothetical protein